MINVTYEPLPAVVDPHDALKDEVILHKEVGTNVLFRIDDRNGDIEDAWRRADRIVTGRFQAQRLCPAPLETRGLVAAYDREVDLLTVWSATQAPHGDQEGLAYMLKRDRRTIRVIAPKVGGGFGGKEAHSDMAAVCYLAIKLGRPIKWIQDRGENMISYHGRGISCEVEAAVTNDGTILGLRFRAVGDIGAYFLKSTATPPYHVAPGDPLTHQFPGSQRRGLAAYRGASSLCVQRSGRCPVATGRPPRGYPLYPRPNLERSA